MTRRGGDKKSLLDETFFPLEEELEATGQTKKGEKHPRHIITPWDYSEVLGGIGFFFFFLFRKDLVNFFCNSVDCNPPSSSVHKISQAQEY